MIEFLRSNVGLYWLASVALACQLAGVGIVVFELMAHYRRASKFMNSLNTLERVHTELQADPMAVALEKTSGNDRNWATLILPIVVADMRSRKAEMVGDQIARYLLSAVAVPKRWQTWAGPGLLILGIVLAYLASMFSVR